MPCYIWDFSSPNTSVQGVEPMSPGLEVRSLNHRTTRKVQIFLILYERRIYEDLKEEKCINRVLKYEGELARWRGKKTEKGLGWGWKSSGKSWECQYCMGTKCMSKKTVTVGDAREMDSSWIPEELVSSMLTWVGITLHYVQGEPLKCFKVWAHNCILENDSGGERTAETLARSLTLFFIELHYSWWPTW